VAEDDWLSRTPILVVDFCAVFGADCAHDRISFIVNERLPVKRFRAQTKIHILKTPQQPTVFCLLQENVQPG
jgi:hypothetical protein